jgi:hypothetical protein
MEVNHPRCCGLDVHRRTVMPSWAMLSAHVDSLYGSACACNRWALSSPTRDRDQRLRRIKAIHQAAGQEHLHLTVSHPMFRDVRFVCTLMQYVDLVATLNRFADIRQAQAMPRRHHDSWSSPWLFASGRSPQLAREPECDLLSGHCMSAGANALPRCSARSHLTDHEFCYIVI